MLWVEHHENEQTSRLSLDKIESYNVFKTELSNKIRGEFPATKLRIQECTGHILMYKLSDGIDVSRNSKINFPTRILQDLSIMMCIRDVEMQSQQLQWILGHTNFHTVIWKQRLQMYLNYFVSLDLLLRKRYPTQNVKKCKDILESVGKPLQLFVDEKSHTYFDLINRGHGLTFPSNLLFIVTQFAYLIFNVGISTCTCTMETEFLQLSHQNQTYLGVIERFITGYEDCRDIQHISDSCGATQLKVIMKSLGCFAKTLLNNYGKNTCDDICTSKISRNVAKFN